MFQLEVESWRWSRGGGVVLLRSQQDSISKPRAHTFISSRYNSPVCAQLLFHDTRHHGGLTAATAEGRGAHPTPPSPRRKDRPFDLAVRRFKAALPFKRAYPDSALQQRPPAFEITLPVPPPPQMRRNGRCRGGVNGESDSSSRSADGTPRSAGGAVLFDLANTLVRPTQLTQTDSLEKKPRLAKKPKSSFLWRAESFKDDGSIPCFSLRDELRVFQQAHVVFDNPASAAESARGSVFGVASSLKS